MANDYYNHGGYPSTNAAGDSASLRTELSAIAAGFAKLPSLLGANNEVVHVNSTATGLDATPLATLLSGIAALAFSGTLAVSGAATFASTLGVTGNATVGGTLGVTGALTGSTGAFSGDLSGSLTHKEGGNYFMLGSYNVGTYGAGSAKIWWNQNLRTMQVMADTGTAAATLQTGTLHAVVQHLGTTSDTAATPSFGWSGDAGTGLWRPAAGQIGFATAGTSTWHILDSGSFATHASPPTFTTIGKINVAGTTSTFSSSVVVSRFSNDNAGPGIRFGKSRGTSVGDFAGTGPAPGNVQANDSLGELVWYASNLTLGTLAARVRAVATENFSAGASGAQLELGTITTGSNTFATRLILESGASTFLQRLQITDGTATGQTANTSGDGLVLDSTGNTGITFLGTSGSSIQQILFGDTISNAAGNISYNHNGDTMSFGVNGGVMVLDAGGLTMSANKEVILADMAPTSQLSAGFRGTPTAGGIGTPTRAHCGKTLVNSGTTNFNNSVFAAGDVVAVYNNSAAAISIGGTITTMRLAGTTTTGARTLAARGLATVFFVSGTECIVSGAGVA